MVTIPTSAVTTANLVAFSTLPTAAAVATIETDEALETTRTVTSSVLSMMPYTTPWRASRSIP